MLLLLLIGGGSYIGLKDDNAPKNDANQTAEEDYINLDPPTEEEKTETEENKKSISEDSPAPPASNNGKKQVTPVITSADRSEVRAYVTGIFEDGGTCTATATKGAQVKTATSSGFADFNKTTCAPITISLPDGGWSIVVSYSSSTAEGKSQPYEVD